MSKETLLKFALMLAKFFVVIFLAAIGLNLLEVPSPETFMQLMEHVAGMVLIWLALDINVVKSDE